MKLHLPKLLLTAVLALVTMTPSVQALSITGTGNLVDYTIDATKSYAGCNVTYSVNNNLGTISGLNTSMYTVTFDIDLEALTKTDEYNPMTSYNNVPLMYVNNGSYQWGFHVYDCTHKNGSPNPVADNQPDITGYWSNNNNKMYKENEIFSQISNLTSGTVTAVIAQSKSDGGTRLFDGTDTTVATPYYSNPDLFTATGGTIKSAVFNTSLVKTITVKEYENFQVTAGTVSKTLSLANTALFGGTGKHEVVAGDARLANGADGDGNVVKKNIVVSGTSQLFLQSWNNGTNFGELTVERDIYIGSTSFNGDAAFSGVALRFGNDAYSATNGGNIINVEGDIYVMEDAKLAANTGNSYSAINITGAVTDTVDGVSANSTLTIKGKGYNISGDVSLGGLVVDSNAKATFKAESSLTVGSTITNNGDLELNGTFALRNDDLSGFDSTVYSTGGTTNGLSSYGHLYHLVSGTGTLSGSTTQITYSGNTYNIADGIKIEEGSAYVVATDTVQVGGDNAAADTKGATKFVVFDGATLQLNTREADAALSADALITTTEGEGIIDLRTKATIGKNTVTKFDGTLKVSEGGILQVCQTDYTGEGYSETPSGSADLSSLKAIELAGGELRHASASMSLGNIKVTADSTLNVFDIASGSTLTINSLNLGAELDVVGRWKSNTVITTLSGTGTLDVAAPAEHTESKVLTIASTNNFTGKINQTGGTIRSTAGITVGNITKTGGTLELAGQSSVTQGMSVDSISKTGGKLILGVDNGGNTTKSFSIGTISGNQDLQLHEGSVTLGSTSATTQTLGHLDVSAGGDSVAQVTLKSGATVTTNGDMWLSRSAAIKLENTASLKMGAVTIKGNNASGNGSIQRNDESPSDNGADKYSSDNFRFNISDAAVDVAAAANGTTISNRLVGVALTNTGTGTLTATNDYNGFTSINADKGNINITNSQEQELSSLTIGAGMAVGVYTGDAAPTTPATDNEATVTVASLTAGTGATLNANLVLTDGATVTMADALTMGSTVTLGTGMTLAGDLVSTIKGMSEDGTVDLFTGVDALYLGDSTVASATLDATSGVNLSEYFNFDGASNYYLGYNGTNVFAGVMPVPEPTTATLSLLALAGLVARRRRK